MSRGSERVLLRGADERVLIDGTERWHRPASAAERALLVRLPGPVLDVGCGPGRLVVALAEAGRPALGIDPAPGAVALTTRAGGAALGRSVYDRLPAEGRWGAAVLADGNLGIGADPARLLRRLSDLVRPGGTVVAEVDPTVDGCERTMARLEVIGVDGDVRCGPWFAWAVIGADAAVDAARSVGLQVDGWTDVDGRPHVHLRSTASREHVA